MASKIITTHAAQRDDSNVNKDVKILVSLRGYSVEDSTIVLGAVVEVLCKACAEKARFVGQLVSSPRHGRGDQIACFRFHQMMMVIIWMLMTGPMIIPVMFPRMMMTGTVRMIVMIIMIKDDEDDNADEDWRDYYTDD
jgi:hypothetical protein